jgi:hypothetical protein
MSGKRRDENITAISLLDPPPQLPFISEKRQMKISLLSAFPDPPMSVFPNSQPPSMSEKDK